MKEVIFFAAILALTQASVVRRMGRDGSLNEYIAYTPDDRVWGQVLSPFDPESAREILTANLTVVIIVHGHDSTGSTGFSAVMKNRILNEKEVNVIVVDWSIFANRGYSVAVGAVHSVGRALGDLLTVLTQAGFPLTEIHMIGFDLGAHVCGIAGRAVRQDRNAVGKITGLNPSGLYWGTNSGHLTRGDGRTVEVIHTDSVQNGIGVPIGDIDIFVNRGRNQPGCVNNLCSHNRAYEIMEASVIYNLRAKLCVSLTDAQLNRCTGSDIQVGTIELWKLGSGIYHLTTTRNWPYL